MRSYCLVFMFLSLLLSAGCGKENEDTVKSTRSERRAISSGNDKYMDADYAGAAKEYQRALTENPSSAEAAHNLGLTQIRRGHASHTDSIRQQFLQVAAENMQKVAELGRVKPNLASLGNYNIGNIAFNSRDYGSAVQAYKQALRLNPDDELARRNLRIAQKRLKQQEQKQNQQDQDQQQQQQDQQDQQDKQQQPPKQQENQQQNKQKQNPDDINQQNADQILKAMENKESELRARMARGGNNGKESSGSSRSGKNW